jgi:hypothetical protein
MSWYFKPYDIFVLPCHRFVEFPPPGDEKYYLLHPLADPEEAGAVVESKTTEKLQQKEYWMPVRFILQLLVFYLIVFVY